jgi:2-dehydropantoate 2-reductase
MDLPSTPFQLDTVGRRHIAVVGAGAIGSVMAHRLGEAGHAVTLIARGRQLQAIEARGIAIAGREGPGFRPSRVCEDASDAGPQDCVVLALKSYAIAAAIPRIRALVGPRTPLIPMLNGIPWWYNHTAPGDRCVPLEPADPNGAIWHGLPLSAVVGCAPYIAADIVSPGVVDCMGGNRLVFGEPDGTLSERLAMIAALFADAGFVVQQTRDIRSEIWIRALGTIVVNPVSLLTETTMVEICSDLDLRPMVLEMMAESGRIAAAVGVEIGMTPAERLSLSRQVGPHRTSMLRDYEAGRPVELDAILGAVIELGRRAGVPTPTLSAVLALARRKARLAGCLDRAPRYAVIA